MNNQNTISATGASGTTYNLNVHPLNTSFKAVGGIYIILQQSTALYVGQTSDLSIRFNGHHKEACWLRNGANRMAVMGVSTENQRLAIERDLIAAFNPTCNG